MKIERITYLLKKERKWTKFGLNMDMLQKWPDFKVYTWSHFWINHTLGRIKQ